MKRDDLLMRVYIIHKRGFIIYKKKKKNKIEWSCKI